MRNITKADRKRDIDAALADADHALKEARGIGQATASFVALNEALFTHIACGNYAAANAQSDELSRARP